MRWADRHRSFKIYEICCYVHPIPDTQSNAILDFYRNLRPRFRLGEGISIMNPYKVPATLELASRFYKKFYADNQPRTYIFGINPGRFGAGVTGVPFTDPIRMAEKCGIPNDWNRQAELSSLFVYDMIDGYGGVKAFLRSVLYHRGLSPRIRPAW